MSYMALSIQQSFYCTRCRKAMINDLSIPKWDALVIDRNQSQLKCNTQKGTWVFLNLFNSKSNRPEKLLL